MNTGLIASRYATALFDFAVSQQASSQVYTEAKVLSANMHAFRKMKSMLDNPVVSNAEKLGYIKMAAGGNVCVSFAKFLQFVLEKKRATLLQTILLKYIDLYRAKNNIFYGKITTAYEVDTEVEQRLVSIVEQYTKAIFEIDKVINPEIIGGFLLEFDNTRWDASIQRQLQNIKRELLV